MICFDVSRNGKRVCTAGYGDAGLMAVAIGCLQSSDEAASADDTGEDDLLTIHVGGMIRGEADQGTSLSWLDEELAVGDEIVLRVVRSATCDAPQTRRRRNLQAEARTHKRQLRAYAKKLGWKLTK